MEDFRFLHEVFDADEVIQNISEKGDFDYFDQGHFPHASKGCKTTELSFINSNIPDNKKILASAHDTWEFSIKLPLNVLDIKELLNTIESALIFSALKATDGNKNQAARMLKLNRTTLIEKLRRNETIPGHDLQKLTSSKK
ncbi:MAG: helix-turn-helix domain-containing protein [Oligoflexia bacterium]|nr:helix-turn-helix domain-containing protein [Oligoflexia bacterium]MBF0367026.1 helix-turn-helix domain-containing protein [Oligoflexia bacterium]